MKIIAFVGDSESGKTRLIARLVAELKERGLTVAVVKHCSQGFDFGGAEKDSSKFLAAGADGVALAAPGEIAVLRRMECESDHAALAREQFGAADIVLVEGGKRNVGLKKIEVLRKGSSGGIKTRRQELVAVVADYPAAPRMPTFHPDDVSKLANWLLKHQFEIRNSRF
jgi:molybdopterin-guanine dinucleotide biosynthesis protein B